MFEKVQVIDNHKMILVSKRAIFGFIGALLFLTTALMTFFFVADFDYILGRKDLAMKVGQTTISMSELKKIQKISGIKARQATEQAFASEFLNTLLLAEGARRLELDRKPEFTQKIADFDNALKNAGDDETMAKAVYLLEEMASTARTAATDINIPDAGATGSIPPEYQPPVKLHLKTILLKNAEDVARLLAEQASGTAFAQLNASWSESLYKGVGGDIGWKSAQDFPQNVFDSFLKQPLNTVIEGFTDKNGIHLFAVCSKPEKDPAHSDKVIRERLLKEAKRKRLMQYMIELRNQIYFWVNPSLQIKRQVETRPGLDDSSGSH
ncbi:MAG: hypothetical protein PHV05_04520 [Candidatus Riflebacteria bacterium]|nr:hypothetical protein [Candidatus Riflebacteria bacterium]